jgi:hypothetical protein
MMEEDSVNDVIQQLKRVTLSVKHFHSASGDGSAQSSQLRFFYGIAADGLTPFEMALSDKRVGERLRCDLLSAQRGEYFGHLLPVMHRAMGNDPLGPSLSLEVEVLAVEDPDNRALVQAMARSLGHGCGGEHCDCGCSGT